MFCMSEQKVLAVNDESPRQKFREELARYLMFLNKEELEDYIRLCLETYFSRTKKVEVSNDDRTEVLDHVES